MTKPKAYSGIMVSSTFSDLKDHRDDLIKAIAKHDFHPTVMEFSGAQPDSDVIDKSLQMVQNSAAFVSVISHRYGQTPKCPRRNPKDLSISELEFDEAMRLRRPILLFIMDDNHPVTVKDIETDPVKKAKLDAFRKRAKKMRENSDVERVYEVFESQADFVPKAVTAVGNLSKSLDKPVETKTTKTSLVTPTGTLEAALPPKLRAVPRYLGSHQFVGREAELSKLNDWCAAADPNPMLLFEAIGGSGKSMVTWTWLTEHAMKVRDDWAGRFWFSFYEGGATMTSFCQQALAYLTGKPIKNFYKQRVRQLLPQLIAQLEAKPWLIVLDGLERILVAYHRIDAPQMRDEDVDTATDQISNRDPRATINPEDEDLLRQLTAATKSKILVTSRLTPQALINQSSMPLPGVRREMLGGLRPKDAEALFNVCGVNGESKEIQSYLQRNCDCHPLVIGALAGLINNYNPDRGNFDTWLADAEAGGKLNFADLNLTQRRNHIFDAAIEALPATALKLLQTLSLLQGGADYATLKEFNPHLPPPPEEPADPEKKAFDWYRKDDEAKTEAKAEFRRAQKTYSEAYRSWRSLPDVCAAPKRFDETLKELEQRGLLQYEHGLKRYDLHPVVRGVASGRMDETESGDVGKKVIDYFSAFELYPFEQAKTLQDLAPGIQLVSTLTRIGKFDRAKSTYNYGLYTALHYKFIAFDEMQRLLHPFFPNGWEGPMVLSRKRNQSSLLNHAAIALQFSDELMAKKLFANAVQLDISAQLNARLPGSLNNLGFMLGKQGNLACQSRLHALTLKLSEASGYEFTTFSSLLDTYRERLDCGLFKEADKIWERLDFFRQKLKLKPYQIGNAEAWRAIGYFLRGQLTNEIISNAQNQCNSVNNRKRFVDCLRLHGEWHLSCDEAKLALEPLNEAARLCRESGYMNANTEALLTLAQLRTGSITNARIIVDRLDKTNHHKTALPVAEIWHELGEPDRAIAAALRAHKSACGSGEPYVYRYYLDRAEALLREWGETSPAVPKHDPANDEVFDWEDDVRALIKKTREEREAREREDAEDSN